MTRTNEFGQPIGESIGSFATPPAPPRVDLSGRTTTLVVLDASEHSDELFEAYSVGGEALWTYLQWGPFETVADLRSQLTQLSSQPDWLPYVVMVEGRPEGLACFLRMDPPKASIEIGGITFGPKLQRTTASTEALSLMIRQAFDLGYRRVEWKCDDLNAPSMRAARRLGFHYEGTFRKALHYKGRNRDTAWFSIIDDHWPSIRREHERWLAATNFDAEGAQRSALTVRGGEAPESSPPLGGTAVTLSDGIVALRPWTSEDAWFMAEAHADPAIQRYNGALDRLGYPKPALSTADAKVVISELTSSWEEFATTGTPGAGVAFAIVDAGSGELVGCCGLDEWSETDVVQFGYWIGPRARGRGCATRAAILLTRWLFELGAARVVLKIVSGNEASVGVARRAGFVFEGTMRSHGVWKGQRCDVMLFAAVAPP